MKELTEDELKQIELQTFEEQGFEIINIIRLSKYKKAKKKYIFSRFFVKFSLVRKPTPLDF
jgi:hypothetical protein